MSDKRIFNINGEDPGGGEQMDDFLKRLRESGALDDTEEQDPDRPRAGASYRESEAAREPVVQPVKSDMVLFSTEDAKTTVFKKSDSVKKDDSAEIPAKKSAQPRSAGDKDADAKGAAVKSGGAKSTGGARGKKATSSKKKKKPEKRTWWQKLLRVAVYAICVVLVAGCVLALVLAMYLGKETVGDDELLDLNSIKLSYATILMYKDPETEELVEFERIFDEENRVWINYDEFPKELIEATLASEDQRFLQHKGVDLKRTIGAMINMVLQRLGLPGIWSSMQGGSTLTQQLIKNITQEKEAEGMDGILRKVREIYRAYQMERRFSKDQILEAYLNTMGVGGQVAGIEAGANYYFGKTTSELTAAESAAILCITKYPSRYNPFIDADANKAQREQVLWDMKDQGRLNEQEYQAALTESAAFDFSAGPQTSTGSSAGHITSYFSDMVIDEVMEDLQSIAGYSADDAYDMLFNGGLRIITTMDPFVQEVVEKVALDEEDEIWPDLVLIKEGSDEAGENNEFVGQPQANQIQGAIVVMDFEGHVKGVAGGIRGKTESRGLNRAVDSERQTGSSMKPLGAYGPALEYDRITFSTLFADAPSEVVEGTPWPRNYDRTYGKPVTVYEGLYRSLNTTAVFTIKTIGADASFDFVTTSLGVTSLVEPQDRSYGPMALGSMTKGITPLEMCAAYCVFGNDGTYTEPHSYTEIYNNRDELIIDKTTAVARNKALSDDTAMIMNRLLQGVMQYGTGTTARPRGTDLPYAGKTGTASENRDYWCIAMNPYYCCAVWQGYDEPEPMKRPTQHPTQLAVRAVLGEISADLEYKDFPVVDTVVRQTFCMDSGKLASAGCTRTRTGYYKKGFTLTETCNPAEHFPDPVEEPAA